MSLFEGLQLAGGRHYLVRLCRGFRLERCGHRVRLQPEISQFFLQLFQLRSELCLGSGEGVPFDFDFGQIGCQLVVLALFVRQLLLLLFYCAYVFFNFGPILLSLLLQRVDVGRRCELQSR